MLQLTRFQLVGQQQRELCASVVERDSVAEPSAASFELEGGSALRMELVVGHEYSRLEILGNQRQSDL